MTSEWWTYRPGDFLMFSARTYYRLIEQYNRDIWPAHLAAIGAGVVILILAVRRAPGSARAIPAIVSILWLWVAWAFHFERYATINLAAKWFAVAFALQGLLLVGAVGD